MKKVFTRDNVIVCYGAFMKMTEGKTGAFVGCVNAKELEDAVADAGVRAKCLPDWVQTWYDKDQDEHMNAFIFEDAAKRDDFMKELIASGEVKFPADAEAVCDEMARRVQEEWDKEESERVAFRETWFSHQPNLDFADKVLLIRMPALGKWQADEFCKKWLDGALRDAEDKPFKTSIFGGDAGGKFWIGYLFKFAVQRKCFERTLWKRGKKSWPEGFEIVKDRGEVQDELVIKLHEEYMKTEQSPVVAAVPTAEEVAEASKEVGAQ